MEELPSSDLGTKEHWDETYTSELQEFSDHGDVGEVWFGEESEQRIIEWLTEEWLPAWWAEKSAKRAEQSAKRAERSTKRAEQSAARAERFTKREEQSTKRAEQVNNGKTPAKAASVTSTESEKNISTGENGESPKIQSTKTESNSDKEQQEKYDLRKEAKDEETPEKKVELAVDDEIGMKYCSVLDLGTGNGHFLIQLAMVGFTQLFGIDYSDAAICLARAINTREGYDITFALLDLVGPELPAHPLTRRRYSVCHDKGTYDAISITPHTAKRDRERYLLNVSRLLEPDGVFVITSCNWTEEELVPQCQQHFSKIHTIPTPTFSFGGSTGSLVTTLILKKISDTAR